MTSLDGFVHCANYEGFSLAPMEALAANLPLCYVDDEESDNFLGLGLSHAIRSPKMDTDALASNIVKLVCMIKSGVSNINHRMVVCDVFSKEKAMNQYYRIYKNYL